VGSVRASSASTFSSAESRRLWHLFAIHGSVPALWWLCIRSLAVTQQCGKRAGPALPRLVALQIAAECPTSSPSTSSVAL